MIFWIALNLRTAKHKKKNVHLMKLADLVLNWRTILIPFKAKLKTIIGIFYLFVSYYVVGIVFNDPFLVRYLIGGKWTADIYCYCTDCIQNMHSIIYEFVRCIPLVRLTCTARINKLGYSRVKINIFNSKEMLMRIYLGLQLELRMTKHTMLNLILFDQDVY